MSDLIDRQAAIETVMECYDNDELFEVYEDKLRELPPAQPAPSQVAADIARIVENGKDMRVIEAAQPTPDQNGDLWITVPDIDKVTCIYVQESKSKFCRIFYEEQPERIKGHWIKISPANIYECSECGKSVMTSDICAYDFCHGCGADMREVTT